MRLADLLADLQPREVHGTTEIEVGSVQHDSRRVGATDLFVAVPGATVDGRRFVPGLRCAAVIAEGPVAAAEGVTVIQVEDARLALAQAAAALADHPARSLPVVGITGTDGKTTTAALIEAVAAGAGWPSAIIGTTGHRVAGRQRPATHTTPEAPVLQQILSEARGAGCRLAAMEVSSIGLSLKRAHALPFSVAVFTSFSRDHLDFHGNMDAYFAAKAILFEELLRADGVAILNADDPAAARLRPRGRATWTAAIDRPADLRATAVTVGLDGIRARVDTPRGSGDLHLPMVGSYNLTNALLALGAGLALDVPLADALRGLSSLAGVSGRMERLPEVETLLGVTAFVDYAHTPDALRAALGVLRPLVGDGRILTVFGCGGDRDRGKRPQMGAAASRGSDHVVVTSDNPRSEDPASILDDIRPGLAGPATEILDRRAAIREALRMARPGDVLLVAGKGHETGQIVGDTTLPFRDADVVNEEARGIAGARSDGASA